MVTNMTQKPAAHSKGHLSSPNSKPLPGLKYEYQYKTVLNPKRKAKFLQELARLGNATVAGDRVKVSRYKLYTERERDPDFAQAWEDAIQAYYDRCERQLHVRAFEGLDKPLTYKGQISTRLDPKTGEQVPVTVKEYSDQLAVFLMKGNRREKYGDNTNVNVSGHLTLEALVGASIAGPSDPEPITIDQSPEPKE